MKLQHMILVAMFAALTAVLSQVSIPVPFSPVPISLQTFAVALTGAILGSRKGAIALIVYAFMGAVGLPVFAQARAGLPILVGPTGGFIFGFIPAAYLIGRIIEKGKEQTYLRTVIAMVSGLVVIYIVGLLQLKLVLNVSFAEAFILGAAPFLPLEIPKIILGAYLGNTVRRSVLEAFPGYVS